jgi:nucleoside-diphosphate-sugar epimerase
MVHRIFLAGAAGVIGRRLVPLLVDAGYTVFGMTRSPDKMALLRDLAATPVLVDAFDAAALAERLREIGPGIVIHQLTDLPPGLDPAKMAAATTRNARIRREGTRNLVAAARNAGVKRMIAQSIAWAYAPGPEPHAEADPLDTGADGARGISVGGVAALEEAVLQSPPLEGIVLRYGQLYGPGTGSDTAKGSAPLHVDAAASAALLALERGTTGAFNIAEPGGSVAIDKARRELGWDPDFRPDSVPGERRVRSN